MYLHLIWFFIVFPYSCRGNAYFANIVFTFDLGGVTNTKSVDLLLKSVKDVAHQLSKDFANKPEFNLLHFSVQKCKAVADCNLVDRAKPTEPSQFRPKTFNATSFIDQFPAPTEFVNNTNSKSIALELVEAIAKITTVTVTPNDTKPFIYVIFSANAGKLAKINTTAAKVQREDMKVMVYLFSADPARQKRSTSLVDLANPMDPSAVGNEITRNTRASTIQQCINIEREVCTTYNGHCGTYLETHYLNNMQFTCAQTAKTYREVSWWLKGAGTCKPRSKCTCTPQCCFNWIPDENDPCFVEPEAQPGNAGSCTSTKDEFERIHLLFCPPPTTVAPTPIPILHLDSLSDVINGVPWPWCMIIVIILLGLTVIDFIIAIIIICCDKVEKKKKKPSDRPRKNAAAQADEETCNLNAKEQDPFYASADDEEDHKEESMSDRDHPSKQKGKPKNIRVTAKTKAKSIAKKTASKSKTPKTPPNDDPDDEFPAPPQDEGEDDFASGSNKKVPDYEMF